MAAHNFTGTAAPTDSVVCAMTFAPAQHFWLNGGFKCSIATDGIYLAQTSGGHKVVLSGGPYTQGQMQQLWQDLAEIGLTTG